MCRYGHEVIHRDAPAGSSAPYTFNNMHLTAVNPFELNYC